MDSFAIEMAILVSLSLLNGLFSMAELAVVSANKGRLGALAAGGNQGAITALKLLENSGEFLATVQIGITLIGIVAGVFGGATLAEDLGIWLTEMGVGRSAADSLAFLSVVGCISYLSLVLGELVPKQIALSHPEEVATIVSRPLYILSRAARPVVWILDKSTTLVSMVLPFKVTGPSAVSQEDIQHLVTQGAKAGEIETVEKDMVMRIFRLDDRPITAFMTGRRGVVWLDLKEQFEESWNKAFAAPHSYFPVADGTLDQVVGFVSFKDLWVVQSSNGKVTLRDVVRPPLAVPSSLEALAVLEEFKRQRKQIAFVVDEHGGLDGVVTTHDLLEAVVGDLADYDGEAQSIVRRDDGSLLVDASVDIQEVLLQFGKISPPTGESDEYHSVGGVVFGQLRGVHPTTGCSIEWEGLRFEVVDMDRHRIDKVLVSLIREVKS